MIRNKKGFTLIELLIVIAIIGILSSVVLVSNKGAKNKGADAAVKTGLQQIISQAETYYSDNEDTYGETADCGDGIFSEDPVIAKQIAEVDKRDITDPESVICEASDQSIAVSAILKGSGESWCVDNDLGSGPGVAGAEGCEPE